jgi:hypothetical protein
MRYVNQDQSTPGFVYYEPTHELPDDDRNKIAYGWKGGPPLEVENTPVVELPSDHITSPTGHYMYDEHGFLQETDTIAPMANPGFSPGQETLTPAPSSPTGRSDGRPSPSRSFGQTSQGYALSSLSTAHSPPPANQGYSSTPTENPIPSVPPGHYAPNGLVYGRGYNRSGELRRFE